MKTLNVNAWFLVGLCGVASVCLFLSYQTLGALAVAPHGTNVAWSCACSTPTRHVPPLMEEEEEEEEHKRDEREKEDGRWRPLAVPVWPWEKDLVGWENAAQGNRKVEALHREGKTITYFLHISKAGGTTICERATAHGEGTTRRAPNSTIFPDYPPTLCAVKAWNANSTESHFDRRMSETRGRQSALISELRQACDAHGSNCGITFVGTERQMPPQGQLFCAHDRPWVYVAAVREPLDLILSNYIMLADSGRRSWINKEGWKGGVHPPAADLLSYLPHAVRAGHLVAIFSGNWIRPNGNDPDPILLDDEAMSSQFEVAEHRLRYFSAMVEMSLLEKSYEVLAKRLGWMKNPDIDDIRRNTRGSACMRCEPAYQESKPLREGLATLWKYDLRFHAICVALAEKMIADVE